MKIELTLNENFIEELSCLQDFNSLYAAMWILGGIKPIKQHYVGGAIKDLTEFNAQFVYNCCGSTGIYKLGYIQAMMDLEQPLDSVYTRMKLIHKNVQQT